MSEVAPGSGLTRKTFLKSAGAAGAGLLLDPHAAQRALAAGGAHLRGMNVVLFITDQERAIQHFPRGWAKRHLPGLTRLQQHGLTFENAFTNACMCSPARSTMLTGLMPAQHGVRYTLEPDCPRATTPGRAVHAAGQPRPGHVRGRLPGRLEGQVPLLQARRRGRHLGTSDVGRYGFERWNPKDAGANQDPSEGGGGTYPGANNDERYMTDDGDVRTGEEGALAYLRSAAAKQQPFFLVISLVNPHDVLFFRRRSTSPATRSRCSRVTSSCRPPSARTSRPSRGRRRRFRRIFELSGPLPTARDKRSYLNFYANLMKRSDAYLVDTLDALASEGLLDDTVVVRTADHGEMA